MYIKSILWLDEENKEAELEISDSVYSLVCFSFPCYYSIKQKLLEPLECLDSKDFMISLDEKYKIERVNKGYSYRLCGKLTDVSNGIITIGNIVLHIDENIIPKDINNGDFVEFIVSRIDLW